MILTAPELNDRHYLRPIANGWKEAIRKAAKAKEWFNRVAEQAQVFYSGDSQQFWSRKFISKCTQTPAPNFQIVLAKAFEFVAVVGPSLFWQNPQRQIVPNKSLELKPEYFTPYGEMAEQVYQQEAEKLALETAQDELRVQLMSLYLNWTPHEQMGRGLAYQAELAMHDMLICGRGCLQVEKMNYPGSSRTMTGAMHVSPFNIYIDPDCETPDISTARWIAVRHLEPYWELERRYPQYRGKLKGKASIESWDSQGRNLSEADKAKRRDNQAADLVEWYEVYSKCGVGFRLRDIERGKDPKIDAVGDAIEEVCGDYVYICICDDLVLNCATEEVLTLDDDTIAEKFNWPVPLWMDNKWPVQMLDIYPRPGFAWPLAPLAPGLGVLYFLNIMFSRLANRGWSSTRDFIAVAQSAAEEVKRVIEKGDDLAVIPFNDSLNKEIKDLVQTLSMPDVHYDFWRIMDEAAKVFDKTTGLTETLYGLNVGGVQERTAEGAKNKERYASQRIKWMSQKTDQWQDEVADVEKFFARWFVTGHDIAPLVGEFGAQAWDELIANQDPELVVRNMRARILANSARRPNREKDADNLNAAMQFLVPEFSKHADRTGDTRPINTLVQRWCEAVELDPEGFQMGERTPEPPSPEEMQMQQDQHQMEMERSAQEQEFKAQESQAKVEQQQIAAETKLVDSQMKQEQSRQQMQVDRVKQIQDLIANSMKHKQQLSMAQDKHIMGMAQQRQAAKQKQSMNGQPKSGSKT